MICYPAAVRQDVVDTLFDLEVPDPYRWLEDPDSDRTRCWSAEQDALLAAHAATWPGRHVVARTLERLLDIGSIGTPITRDLPGERRQFFARRDPAAQLAVLMLRGTPRHDPARSPAQPEDAREQVLIDPMRLDASGATTLDTWSVSPQGHLVAYQVSAGGSEDGVLRVLDVATGADVDGPLDRVRYSHVAWLRGAEAAAFYYVRRLPAEQVAAEERQYHRRIYLHMVGQDPAEDVEVFGAGQDPTNSYGVDLSRDGRWLVVSAKAGSSSRRDVWLADLSASSPDRPQLQPVAVGLDAASRAWVGRGERLYVHTNLGAPRARLCVADISKPGPDDWADLLPEDGDAVLADVAVVDSERLPEPLLLVHRRRHAASQLAVHRLRDGAHLTDVQLPGIGSLGALVTAADDRETVWFTYADHVTPRRVLALDAATLTISTWASPPGTPPDEPPVTARAVRCTSRDGTVIRMIVLARTDMLADGGPSEPRPTILRGYGGFGMSMTPMYSPSALAWVRAGGIWVVPHLRGGGEEGRNWHKDGAQDRKQNVFDDLHAAASWLLAGGWTTSDQLAVAGESNGGLLVGAAVTQHPELFAAALCSSPLLDMARYELHGLGASWVEEYGSAHDPTQLRWLLSYSPYHHVRADVPYPAVLVTVADGDTRVDPLHGRKMVAALQHATTASIQTTPVLLRRESRVGHGARTRSRLVGLLTDGLLFLAHHTGLVWPAEP